MTSQATDQRWFSSDLHLGHRNIITYCGRPFADADHMNVTIINRLAAIPGTGELWLLGDIALGDPSTLNQLNRISRPITLVAGNHDRCFGTGEKADRWAQTYQDISPVTRLHRGNTTLTLLDGTDVNVSHFPYAGDSRNRDNERPDRYLQHRPNDDGRWLLCGHVHEKWRQHGRMINVGIDAWGGQPVSETQIVELINAGPQDLPALTWR